MSFKFHVCKLKYQKVSIMDGWNFNTKNTKNFENLLYKDFCYLVI